MIRVRFLEHAPPYMPGDIILAEEGVARTLEGKGIVAVVPDEPLPPKDRDPAGSASNSIDGAERAGKPAKT